VSSYKIVNLTDYLTEFSEESVCKSLSSYSCEPNNDVEFFLQKKAISSSMSSSSRTFIVSEEKTNIFVGFFTLTQKSIVIEKFFGITKSLEKKIRWFSDEYQIGFGDEKQSIQVASLILIAHLGKNYTKGANELITGQQLLNIAVEKIVEIQGEIGGRFICVECEDTPNLLNYYTQNGFSRLQNRPISVDKDDYFVQLVRTS
jgi:hypothetical protein